MCRLIFIMHEISWYYLPNSSFKHFCKNISIKNEFENVAVCAIKRTLNLNIFYNAKVNQKLFSVRYIFRKICFSKVIFFFLVGKSDFCDEFASERVTIIFFQIRFYLNKSTFYFLCSAHFDQSLSLSWLTRFFQIRKQDGLLSNMVPDPVHCSYYK